MCNFREKEDKTAWSVAQKIQTRDRIEGRVTEADANERGKDFDPVEIKFVLRGGHINISFCSQLPVPCLPCTLCFGHGSCIDFSSNCFDLGNQLPPVYSPPPPPWLGEEASWAFSSAEGGKSFPTPTAGFISLCSQIAVITRV